MSPSLPAPLWQPSPERVATAAMTAFIATVNRRYGVGATGYDSLWRWSVAAPAEFWRAVWDVTGVIGDGPGAVVVDDPDRMPGAQWFPAARLNFAENLLRRSGGGDALVFRGEDKVARRLSHDQLAALVSRLQQALRAAGIGVGDRVAAYLPNLPETVAFMLAAASLGAVWSSASPDFGVAGVLDRFGQIAPTLLVAADGYFYSGNTYHCRDKLAGIVAGLPSLRRVVVVPYTGDGADLSAVPGAVALADFVAPFAPRPLEFARLPFAQPLMVMFSSGTTGKPKCIVHSAGGTLLQHLKEHRLHCDVRPGDRVFYFTTCGWMMWNWLVSALASEASAEISQFHIIQPQVVK